MIIGSMLEHSQYLGKALDATWMRNNVIQNNIANIDTPNFKASKVEFETLLSDAISGDKTDMKKTRTKHFGTKSVSEVTPIVTQDVESDIRMDGNNVDMNTEQAELAQNTLEYYTLLQKLSKDISRLKYVIEAK
jgi:flagellar basal-body rod protein FlgB